jgi:hypothetical protein
VHQDLLSLLEVELSGAPICLLLISLGYVRGE